MRYFLDTEYNGWRGELLSLALVPEFGSEEYYVTLKCEKPFEAWVEQHVVPYLDMVPENLRSRRLATDQAARELSNWLVREYDHTRDMAGSDGQLHLLADWPEDISHVCNLLMIGPGMTVEFPPMTFTLVRFPGFSPAANSKVPHNALHDARALRDHVLAME